MRFLRKIAVASVICGMTIACGKGGAQDAVTLESLNEAVTQLQARVASLEEKVPADLSTSLEGTWSVFEFSATDGSSGSQGQIAIDANFNFTVTISLGGALQSLPCTTGTLSVDSIFNAQSTVNYNCGAQGTGKLFVLDSRENGLLLLDIDDDVVLRLLGAAS